MFVCIQEIAMFVSIVLLLHSRYKVDVRIGNYRKKILSLPKCDWESSGRTRTLGTSGNNEEGESEMDGGILVQYRNVLPTIITGSIAVTRQSSHYPASSQYFDNLSSKILTVMLHTLHEVFIAIAIVIE